MEKDTAMREHGGAAEPNVRGLRQGDVVYVPVELTYRFECSEEGGPRFEAETTGAGGGAEIMLTERWLREHGIMQPRCEGAITKEADGERGERQQCTSGEAGFPCAPR